MYAGTLYLHSWYVEYSPLKYGGGILMILYLCVVVTFSPCCVAIAYCLLLYLLLLAVVLLLGSPPVVPGQAVLGPRGWDGKCREEKGPLVPACSCNVKPMTDPWDWYINLLIYNKKQPNVGKVNIPYMDPMGNSWVLSWLHLICTSAKCFKCFGLSGSMQLQINMSAADIWQ